MYKSNAGTMNRVQQITISCLFKYRIQWEILFLAAIPPGLISSVLLLLTVPHAAAWAFQPVLIRLITLLCSQCIILILHSTNKDTSYCTDSGSPRSSLPVSQRGKLTSSKLPHWEMHTFIWQWTAESAFCELICLKGKRTFQVGVMYLLQLQIYVVTFLFCCSAGFMFSENIFLSWHIVSDSSPSDGPAGLVQGSSGCHTLQHNEAVCLLVQ